MEQPIIKIKSKDKPRKERYKNPNYDKEYSQSEAGKAADRRYKETHFEACRNRIYRCQIRKRIEKFEERLTQIKENSDLYKTTLEKIKLNKERLLQIEEVLKLNKEQQILIKEKN